MSIPDKEAVHGEPEQREIETERQAAHHHDPGGGKDREREVAEGHDHQGERHARPRVDRPAARHHDHDDRRGQIGDDPEKCRDVEGKGLRLAHEVDDPETPRHLIPERLDCDEPEQLPVPQAL
ncbi:MAG: hypothetical protein E6K09_04160 [Methanobacteriota archaeon]|nr:MAG: hypothetical protein E6K09_04160 [Euryarchaeota archaeon]